VTAPGFRRGPVGRVATAGIRPSFVVASAALVLAANATCATNSASAENRRGGAPEGGVGGPVPELVVQRLNGKSIAVSSLRGKVVLLDVWASWCGPCKKELPALDGIASRLKSRGVEILAVSIDQERENVDKFVATQSKWSLTLAHDANGAIADKLQPATMPTSYVIDRAGIIRAINSGFVPADAPGIEKRLADLASAK